MTPQTPENHSLRNTSLHQRDIAAQLHPQTNLIQHEVQGPVIIARGEGIHIYDDAGRQYIEGMSGLWCATLGMSEDRLAQAAMRQFHTLPFYQNFAHHAVEPAIELSEALLRLAPVPMSKVLFQSTGSEANDTAIKLIWYYNHARGMPGKSKIISRHRSYHGTTIAAASLTGLPPMHQDFNLPLPGFLRVTCPHFYREGLPGETEEAFSTRLAAELEALIIAEGPETIGGFFAEPVMGTGGVVVPPEGYFEKIQNVLRKYDILLVADEVITGFGRTGNWWGSQTFGVQPDIITCAKALTAAYMPLAAILISEEIYQGVKSQSARHGIFAHGSTYGAHPVACAVANEALRIYQEDGIIAKVPQLGAQLGSALRKLTNHPLVGEVRGVGLMWAVEIVADKQTRAPFPPERKIVQKIQAAVAAKGLICRAVGSALVLAPPLIVTKAQIDEISDRFGSALNDVVFET